MYVIISGTNRKSSFTLRVSELYQQLLKEKKIDSRILSLVGLNVLERTPEIIQLEQEYLVAAEKFIFISPEYNGSIPGVLKCLIDVTDYRTVWPGKKALLTGVSRGRAGNLRGMDHLTGILHYTRTTVHPNKLPLSVVDTLFEANVLSHAATLRVINEQLDEFIDF